MFTIPYIEQVIDTCQWDPDLLPSLDIINTATLYDLHNVSTNQLKTVDFYIYSLRLAGVGKFINQGYNQPVECAETVVKGDKTWYCYVPLPDPDPNDPNIVPDLRDLGLLKSISQEDYLDTDIYVYKEIAVQEGEFTTGSEWVKVNRIEGLNTGANAGFNDSEDTRFRYQIAVRNTSISYDLSEEQKEHALEFNMTMGGAKWGDQYMSKSFVNINDDVKVIGVNRKTGYTGSMITTIAKPPDGVIDVTANKILYLEPPNLKIKVLRDSETSDEDKKYLIGFEGSALSADRSIEVYTEWKDNEGAEYPEDLEGYTGVMVKLVEGNNYENQFRTFSVTPGKDRQVLILPSTDINSVTHWYIYVFGNEPAKLLAIGEGPEPMVHRPRNFVPVMVPVYDKFNTCPDGRKDDSGYCWLYRPEMQFSVFSMENIKIGRKDPDVPEGDPLTIDLENSTQQITISKDEEWIDVFFDLYGPEIGGIPLDPLPRFGQERQLVLAVGENFDYVDVTIDAENQIRIDNPGDYELDEEDMLMLSLAQLDDPENILWSYEIEVTPAVDLEIQGLPEENTKEIDEAEEKISNEEVPGAFITLNRDDDDNNGTPDKDDVDMSISDDDLVHLKINYDPEFQEGILSLDILSGSENVLVWEDDTKTSELGLPKEWNISDGNIPNILYIEGINNSAVPQDVKFKLSLTDGTFIADDVIFATVMDVAWVNDKYVESKYLPIPSESKFEYFDHDPGEPGGSGGFGGPPVESGFFYFSDPFTIENLEIITSDDPVSMNLTLTSNVSEWSKEYVLTVSQDTLGVFVDADDSLAVQVIKYSDNLDNKIDNINLFISSIAFGVRNPVTVYETGINTNLFGTEHFELIIDMNFSPRDDVTDMFEASLNSNLTAMVVTDTLRETGNNTSIYKNLSGTFTIALTNFTENGFEGRADLTGMVDSSVFGINNVLIDAIETNPGTLEFRTDALHNSGHAGDSGVYGTLALGEILNPSLKESVLPEEEVEAVIIINEISIVPYDLKWSLPKVNTGGNDYIPLRTKNGDQVVIWAIEIGSTLDNKYFADMGIGGNFNLVNGNLYIRVTPGDKILVKPKKHPCPIREVTVIQVKITELIDRLNYSQIEYRQFDYDTNNSELYIRAKGWSDDNSLNNALEWRIDNIGDIEATIEYPPESVDKTEVIFRFNGLPANNDDFGYKWIYLKDPRTGLEASVRIKVFFKPGHFTNPDGTVPNWYYYWTQTIADYGQHVWADITQPPFDQAPGTPAVTPFYEAENIWKCFIYRAYNTTVAGTWNGASGIDYFANILRHEEQHRLDFNELWGENYFDRSLDHDGDFLPTQSPNTSVYERDLLSQIRGKPGYEGITIAHVDYDPDEKATNRDPHKYGEAYNDGEDWALWKQEPWTNGTANSVDWSKSDSYGKQWINAPIP